MKLRILIAAIVALVIHAILFISDFWVPSRAVNMLPSTNVLKMTLASPRNNLTESQTHTPDVNVKELRDKNKSIQTQTEKKQNDTIHSDHRESVSVIHKGKPLDLLNKPPVYPRIARQRGYQGTVVLKLLVNKNGTVSQCEIIQSSGYWMLDDAALRAVKDWIFEPGTDGRKTVDIWVEQPVIFRLQ